jgi:heme/copper-type cytochrome/quinol oxidase subunit 2
MSPRAQLRVVTAAALLCMAARPAFADVAPVGGDGFLAMLVVIVVIALGMLFVFIRAIVVAIRRSKRRPADPPIPKARVVKRNKSS